MDCLDIVAVRIEQERGVISGVIGALARRTVILAACGQLRSESVKKSAAEKRREALEADQAEGPAA